MKTYGRFLAMAAASAAVMSATGCVCVVADRSGDVTFLWTFEGRQCFEVPEVSTVTIQVPGQTLQNAGSYPCQTAGTAGITLLDFRAGTYDYFIQGRNLQGGVLYEKSGKFSVGGNVTVNANLAVSGAALGSTYLTWSFPPSSVSQTPSCAQTSGPIVAVLIRIDGEQTGTEVSCVAGQMGDGVRIDNLSPGVHSIDLAARSAAGFYYYRKVSSFTVIAGSSAANHFAFDWGVGSLPIKWTFTNGTTQLGCAEAGVREVLIQLRDSNGVDQYEGAGVAVSCSNAYGIRGTQFPYLYPGVYQIYLQAAGAAGILYKSNFAAPATGTVVAGQFPTLDVQTQVIVMQP